jgi:hypothetical protein
VRNSKIKINSSVLTVEIDAFVGLNAFELVVIVGIDPTAQNLVILVKDLCSEFKNTPNLVSVKHPLQRREVLIVDAHVFV